MYGIYELDDSGIKINIPIEENDYEKNCNEIKEALTEAITRLKWESCGESWTFSSEKEYAELLQMLLDQLER